MKTININLYFKDAKSDKVYHVSLEKAKKLFVVNFAYGKRDGNLKEGTKTSAPVDYDKALAVYEKLVKSKTDKGYQMDTSAKPSKKSKKTVEKVNDPSAIVDEMIRRLQEEEEVVSLLKTIGEKDKAAMHKKVKAYLIKNKDLKGKQLRNWLQMATFFLSETDLKKNKKAFYNLLRWHYETTEEVLSFYCPDWFEQKMLDIPDEDYLVLMRLHKAEHIDINKFDWRIPASVPYCIVKVEENEDWVQNLDQLYLHKETLESHIYLALKHPNTFHQKIAKGVNWISIILDLVKEKKLDKREIIESIYESNIHRKWKDKGMWSTMNSKDSQKYMDWNFELLSALELSPADLMIVQDKVLDAMTSPYSKVKQQNIEWATSIMSEEKFNGEKYIQNTKSILAKATAKEATKIITDYKEMLKSQPQLKDAVVDAAKEGLKNSAGVKKSINAFLTKNSNVSEKEIKDTQTAQQKPKKLTKEDTGGLTIDQIKKVSQLLLSVDDVNSKLALSILENQTFPKILLTEIFCLYKMTSNDELRDIAAEILNEHGSDEVIKMMDREMSLGEEGRRYTTEKKIMKNIKSYVEDNELDGIKLAIALYKKYDTGVTYLLQEASKEQQVEVFKTFLNGTKLKLNDRALTKFPPAIFEFPELTHIDLSDNKIGSLPAKIGMFSKLKVLNLGKNKIKSINKNISKLSKLEKLYLNDNVIEGGPPAVIFELAELRELDLTDCKDQDEVHELPMNITQLKKLENFKLDFYTSDTRNKDSYSNYPQIKKVTGSPINMEPLAVAEAAFDQADHSPVSYIFEHGDERLIKKVLDHFYDAKTQSFDFSKHFLAMLPDVISSYKVKILNLSETNFGAYFPPYEELNKVHIKRTSIIGQLKNLEELILDDCYLHGIADLSGLTNLRKLSIKDSPSLHKLFDLTPLKKLEDLELDFVRLGKLPQGIFSLGNLKRLSLSSLYGYDQKNPIIIELAELKNLKKLNTLHLKLKSNQKYSKADQDTIQSYLPNGCKITLQ